MAEITFIFHLSVMKINSVIFLKLDYQSWNYD